MIVHCTLHDSGGAGYALCTSIYLLYMYIYYVIYFRHCIYNVSVIRYPTMIHPSFSSPTKKKTLYDGRKQ